ncbi:sulfatase-like hydrolase/transferase [Aureibacter tunicatorum]|uniref:Arylsulfatase A-like enzyme n=1 Tax=Aureibacter tunicatorum TaxID=866807 RepID=A0AAE3XU20_9BACT|nr:sulfatase-like hydrolase/transferase [Aureibacter tunicatorum]MDR6241861.1 arylsulfatase A-like enzyme [Aureibacter tunicatorum]BDD07108.1 sulfatase [Aureibacter tunicatorum]
MSKNNSQSNSHLFGNGKNVLLIMADEFRFPIPENAGGMVNDLKNILGFQNLGATSTDADDYISDTSQQLFPGFMKLRENAAILKNHTVATTACVPSRTAMFTGQYGSKNKVTQTDGVFKGASEKGFNWLDPEGLPTLGDWFKKNNYSTHYFGKCHFAHPEKQSLKNWGFDDWETSFPEPHGTLKNNLGMYRDNGFTDLVTTFLRRKGMALDYDQEVGKIEMDDSLTDQEREEAIENIDKKPWFAVASFTNPHDITTWPVLPAKAQGVLNKEADESDFEVKFDEPLGIPDPNTRSTPPDRGTWTFDMNPGGIDKTYAKVPKTWKEDLLEKPDCQIDYSLKLGVALAAKTGKLQVAKHSHELTGIPLALAAQPRKWTAAYMEYYAYLHHILDKQIERVLNSLEESGLRDDTIVVFVPDHGEYGGSHGMMMQKWHSAYQEAIHVPVVISMPKEYDISQTTTPKQIDELTSHIDIVPTLLGLAGINEEGVEVLRKLLGGSKVPNFVGADLSDLITGEARKIKDKFNVNGKKFRDSILFTTSDMISEPIGYDKNTESGSNGANEDFDIFLEAVDYYREDLINQYDDTKPGEVDKIERLERMQKGPIVQPAEVHCVREGDWKLVRYRDFHNPDDHDKYQWEMYNLSEDPMEELNLLRYKSVNIKERIREEIGNIVGQDQLISKEAVIEKGAKEEILATVEDLATSNSQIEFKANPRAVSDFGYSETFIEDRAGELYKEMLILIEKML